MIETEDGLGPLRRLVLGDAALQLALAGCLSTEAFGAAVRDAARARGLLVDDGLLAAATRPDPLGLGRFSPPPLAGGGWPGPGWLPARVASTHEGPAFDWARFGMGGLAEPFFEDAVRRVTTLPLNRLLRWRHALPDLVAGCPGAAPTPAGLVFHLSRCGSTLLARLLASAPGHAKLSEPEPLDAVVQWAAALPPGPDGAPHPDGVAALRAIVAALMNNLEPGTRAFFKLDCWHIAALPLFRAAFPTVPWLFLYRDPLEVAVSQLAMPGVHVVPGMTGAGLLGLSGGEHLAAQDYVATVLGRICALAVAGTRGGGGLLLHYNDIFDAMAVRLPAHFGYAPDAGAAARLDSLRGDNAKHPGQAFSADGAAKLAQAGPPLRNAIDRAARPHYDALEEMRKASF